MPDFMNLLRLKHIFAPDHPIGNDLPSQGGITGNLPRIDFSGKSDNDLLDYTPQHDYSDLYRKELDQMPIRKEPGKLRRVFGAMAGLGENGPQNQEMVKYGSYNRQLGDWENRIKAIQPGMTAERYENANERMLAQSSASDVLRSRDITRKENTDASNIAIRQQRADAYEQNLKFKQDHQKHELRPIPGGNYVWFNPDDPEESPVDTGIKTGTLSKLEEINLGQKNAMARIAATGGENRKTENTREAGRIKLEDVKQKGRTEIKQNKDAQGNIKSTTTTVYDADGNVTGTKTVNATTKPVEPKAVPGNVNKVRMKAPDGREVMVPMDKVSEAEQRGAKKVGK